MNCQYENLPQVDLPALLSGIPLLDFDTSFSEDVDDANRVLLDPAVSVDDKEARLRQWLSRFQPCMFGRLGAKNLQGIRYDMCWITPDDLLQGIVHVVRKIQRARSEWKERASEGLAHGFLIMFNAPEFAYAKPGPELVNLSLLLANLYLVEHAPVKPDVVYTDTVPFRHADGSYETLRGGINIFHTSAHRTNYHDRRIPGGISISVNSPGLLANSFVKRGLAPDLERAIEKIRSFAWASIGNGGIGKLPGRMESCSWHNLDIDRPVSECPMRHRPRNVPENFSGVYYSALYHTDVLVPSNVMLDPTRDTPRNQCESWSDLDFGYLTPEIYEIEHENFGFMHGLIAPPSKMSHTTWKPMMALNAAAPSSLS